MERDFFSVVGLVNAMNGSSVTHLVLEHALRIARDKGWNILPADASVTFVPAYDARTNRHVNYWDVMIKIRAAQNRHRPLTKDGHIAGIIRISDDGFLDTLKESDDALRARLSVSEDG